MTRSRPFLKLVFPEDLAMRDERSTPKLRRDYERLVIAARRYRKALRAADSLYVDPKTVDTALQELKAAALALGPPLRLT